MKRSNRLILLIGILLAVVAFVEIIVIFQGGGGVTGGGAAPTPPAQLPTVYAKTDIPFGTTVTASMVESQLKPVDQRAADAFGDVRSVIGRTMTTAIIAGNQLEEADFALSRAGQAPIAPNIAPGLRAVAVQVDQVSGVGTLINVGDRVDVIAAFDSKEWIMPVPPVTGNAVPSVAPVAGNATTVKVLVEGLQVVGTLLPPPAATQSQGQPSPSAAPEAGTTALTGQQEIVIVAATPQQAEIIRFAQLDGTITLALRSPKDFVDANGKPVVPPVDKTTGIILKTLVEQYGVLPPDLTPVTVKGR